MSLDVSIYLPVCIARKDNGEINIKDVVFWVGSVTHNLIRMATYVEAYTAIWSPEELYEEGNIKASDIIPHLEKALQILHNKPDECKKYNPSNGRGSYDILLNFIQTYLTACNSYNMCYVTVSR